MPLDPTRPRISGTQFMPSQPATNSRLSLSASFRGLRHPITGDPPERGPLAIDFTPEEPCAVCAPATLKLAEDLFLKWNKALATRDPKAVTACYWDDAVLLPTVSNVARTNPAEIQDYFSHFLAKSPQGTVTERNLKIGCNKMTDAGHYVFRIAEGGKVQEVAARYTFVYENRNGVWKILHHHSSVLPG